MSYIELKNNLTATNIYFGATGPIHVYPIWSESMKQLIDRIEDLEKRLNAQDVDSYSNYISKNKIQQ